MDGGKMSNMAAQKIPLPYRVNKVLKKRFECVNNARSHLQAMRDAIPKDEEKFYFAQPADGSENTSETGTVHFSQVELQRKRQLTKILMEKDSEREDSLPKSATEVDNAARAESDYKDLKKLHLQALAAFEVTMQHLKKRRAELQARIQDFEERKRNFQQFIVDNLQKIKRQHKHFTECRFAQIVARNVMADILKHTKAMRERCLRLQAQILALKKSEEFLMEAIALLPADILKRAGDPITSLMMRFETLTFAQRSLVQQFQDKELENERQIRESREKRENDQREIMQKMAEIQQLSSKVEVWRERVQEEFNSKERIQDKICGELQRFITCVRGLRNITRKAEGLLKSLHYKDVISSDVDEASLMECLQLLHFLFSVVLGIKAELKVIERKTQGHSKSKLEVASTRSLHLPSSSVSGNPTASLHNH